MSKFWQVLWNSKMEIFHIYRKLISYESGTIIELILW